MDTMSRALERAKMIVGMEVDDQDEEAQQQSSFFEDLNRDCALSTKQRLYGFAICLSTGLFCTILSMLLQSNQIWDNIHFWQFACNWKVHNKLLTLVAIILEFGALVWYSLSYIPFARSVVSKIMASCFDTEF